MNTENNQKDIKKIKKKRMLIAIIIVSVLGVISYVLLENPQIFEKKEVKKATSMYSDKLYSYIFHKCEDDFDVTTDEWYMQLDRSLHYKSGNVSVMVLDEELSGYNNAVKFFKTYFETVVAGDEETYNTYFTDRYYENNDPYISFAPQMIYDIEVEQLSEKSHDDGTTSWSFNVKYKIHKNNGTFRNDLDSDSTKTLYYELIGDKQGNVKIDYVTYYKR